MHLLCLDLEGVLMPEIWIGVAERTGIAELRMTTRDEPDYDKLMRRRIAILEREGLGIADIHAVIGAMDPLPGAREFLDWARERLQVLILSDTFYQFATPLMRKLGWPTLFCHFLDVDAAGRVTGYRLRQKDAKREAIRALHGSALQGDRRRRLLQRHHDARRSRSGHPLLPARERGARVPAIPGGAQLRRAAPRDRGGPREARLMAARFASQRVGAARLAR